MPYYYGPSAHMYAYHRYLASRTSIICVAVEDQGYGCGYVAYDERNYEPGLPIGSGATAAEAVEELLEAIEEREAKWAAARKKLA